MSYHKCSARGSQYQQLVQGRRPPHKGHSHRVTRLGWGTSSQLIQAWYQRQGCQGHAWRTHAGTRRKQTFVVAIEIGDKWGNHAYNLSLAGPPSTSSLRCQPLFADLSLRHNLGGDPPPLRCLLFHTSPPHQQVSSEPGNERVDLFIPCEGLISRVPLIKRVRAAQ